MWTGIGRLQATDGDGAITARNSLITINASKQGNPHINFDDSRELDLGENVSGSQPVALVSADFDSDGVADVITADTSGSLQLLKGIDPANFAIDPTKKKQARPEPFTAYATGASLGISPDYLFAGDYNADGKQDVLAAVKGGSGIVVMTGDGLGHFSRRADIAVGGKILAVGSGEIGKPDGQADLAVAFSNENGSFLAVYEHPESAFKHAPEIIKLPSAAISLAIGNTDEDFYSDIAVACGNYLVIVHERGQAYPWDIVKDSGITRPPAVVETRKMPFSIANIAIGRFGEKRGTSLALLGGDGNIYHLEAPKTAVSLGVKLAPAMAPELRAGPFEPADSNGRKLAMISQEPKEAGEVDAYRNPTGRASERKDPAEMLPETPSKTEVPTFDPEEARRRNIEDAPRKAAMQKRAKNAFMRGISAKATKLAKWEITQITTANRFAELAGSGAKLTRASVSDSPFDDLIVTSPNSGRMDLVLRPRDESRRLTGINDVIDGDGGILAILPLRINLDGLSDLVVLRQGSSSPEVVMSSPSAVFVVNTTADDADCNFGGSCSLRDAIRRANMIGGSSTIYFELPTAPAVIAPLTPLPAILRPITIQGNHLPNGTKMVEISGENMGGAVDGLKIRASNAVIFDLAVTGFKSQTINGSQVGGNGIVFESDSAHPNNTGGLVIDCYLGIDVTGTTEKKNMAAGVLIFDSDNNNVARSTLSGNNTGIAIEGGNSNNIQENIMGLNAAGTAKVPNFRGMFLAGADNLVGGDIAGSPNTISGNGVVSNIAPCVGYGIEVPIFVDLTTQELLSHDNNIAGNKLGTDPTGGVGLGNCWQGINAHPLTATTIGSITESGRNIISGNGHGGVWCESLEYSIPTEGGFCSIMGNNVGTDITGSYSIRNGDYNAPEITSAAGAVLAGTNLSLAAVGAPGGTTQGGPCTGFCNLVSGNAGGDNADVASGIEVGGPGIAGIFNNYIGTKRNGTQELRNQGEGIDMASTIIPDAAPAYFAGGHTEFDGSLGNLVAGNNSSGILAGPNGGPGEYHIVGNLVGTDVSGTNPIPNSSGIQIATSFANLVDIGDSDPLGSNVIAGNTFDGINIFSGFGVKIVANAIGVNSSGAPLGNGRDGVTVGGFYAISTIVGGTDATTSNIISNNGKNGVRVNGITSTYNSIRGNVIYNNGNLGIDLSQSAIFTDADGVTPNDDCQKDADLGPNRLQNYPVLFAPVFNPDGTVRVTGTLISTPFSHFRLDVYANLVADPSGHGEGRSFLGTAEITLDGNGFGSIDWNSIATAPNGAYISATATDDLGNTSEFSCNAGQSCDGNAAYKDLAEYMASAPPTCPASIVVNIDTDEPDVTGDQVCDVITSNSGLQCSLRAALELVNNPSYLGPHEIRFDIPGSGVKTISPATPLPALTRQADIRATTQPGWSPNTGPMIEVSGVNQPSGGALVLAGGSNGSSISGLTINRFLGDGITIESNSNNVELCYIGLNSNGTGYPNRRMVNGIKVTGSDNQIGTSGSLSPNFITANLTNQVLITGTGATMNRVYGNWIGATSERDVYISLPSTGIRIDDFASQNSIGGDSVAQQNVIGGQRHSGIEIFEGSHDNNVNFNLIDNNYIGISVIRARSNKLGVASGVGLGLRLLRNLDAMLLGDDDPPYPAPNAAKGLSSYRVLSQPRPQSTPPTSYLTNNNQIRSCFIDADNQGGGINIDKANANTIGNLGNGTGEGNRIINSQNAGIFLTSDSFNNTIRGNVIGLDGDGQTPRPNKNGIELLGKNNNIRSNTISGNTESGIQFRAVNDNIFPSGNKVFSNFIGTDTAGMLRVANGRAGIYLEGQENDIGLTGQGNLISGNTTPNSGSLESGIEVGIETFKNRITGNRIGTKRDQSGPLGNKIGVLIYGFLTTLKDNVISGNSIGVVIARHPEDDGTPPRKNVLIHNWIGTDSSGEQTIKNVNYGIEITNGASETTIGGKNPGDGNVISGNGDAGIFIGKATAQNIPPSLTEVFGNFIGTNGDGTRTIPNEKTGILIENSAVNDIGGFANDIPGARNYICGSGFSGIAIIGNQSAHNRVSGNHVGVGSDGSAIGNTGSGVYIGGGAHDNTIGGTEPNAGNLIENNGRNGVALAPDAGTGNLIDPNTIAGNAMRGITLNETAAEDDIGAPPPEPVLNDELDFDQGANKLQNYPEIATYNINSGGDLIVSYRVDSSPGNSSYGFSEGIRVEFFKPDAIGQGEKFLNSDQFKFEDFTGGGNKTINLGNAALMGFIVGDRITATATDFEGNTSEFSPVVFAPTAAGVKVSGRVRNAEGRGLRSARVSITDQNGSVRITTTTARGFFHFEDVETGHTYVIAVNSKRYNFSPRVVQIVDNISDLDFLPEPSEKLRLR
ncbi:MAG: CSLREA domain-containing protein [Pyrinomonadaceae bacterium]